ncbi:GNAT family N-acetyltransferase [Kribbella sp. NPDC006257]|uniref:GNAT family N-acetyltransferase n=1 Tax=Kribbella sp. NPDC006257 TaxID=3156738 RepID=UPI0033AE6D80
MATFEGWPAGIEARPIGKADTQAWAELLAAKEKVEQAGENYDAEDLQEELEDPGLDPGLDTIGLWADGVMVGYGKVQAPDSVVDLHRVRSEGTIHPEWRGRGLGAALLGWIEGRAAELHAERRPGTAGEINTMALATNTAAGELLTSRGFEACRYFFHMQRPFDTAIPGLEAPAGLRTVGYDPAYDEALRLTHNEVFLDHWGSSPHDPDSWKTWFTGSRAFRPNLSFLVLDGEEIVSYSLGYEWVADTAVTGIREVYVGQVGTRRTHRGRGLAGVTLSKVMAAAAAGGFQRASLGVDAENPTGALGLYESLGFTVESKTISYRRPLG